MILFSVCKNESPSEDNRAIERSISILSENGSFATVCGVYNKLPEIYFLTSQKEVAMRLINEHGQNHFFEKGQYGYWYLIDVKTNNVLKFFKTIKEVNEEQAKKEELYIVSNGKYYIGVQ